MRRRPAPEGTPSKKVLLVLRNQIDVFLNVILSHRGELILPLKDMWRCIPLSLLCLVLIGASTVKPSSMTP